MITITKQKPLEEIVKALNRCQRVYIIGCGTCPTMLHTGGKSEVLEMKRQLEEAGKEVVDWMVIPTACDPITKEALIEHVKQVEDTDCFLVMSCAYGVQTVGLYSGKAVYPALNTLFIGKEESPGYFVDICAQCGDCVLGLTGGICPVVRCAKGLLNGPCGGSVEGNCEVDPDTPCAWQLVIDRLTGQGRLDELDEIAPVKDWGTSNTGVPRKTKVGD
jgi:hypothetical protein